jgi:hypothetical protein
MPETVPHQILSFIIRHSFMTRHGDCNTFRSHHKLIVLQSTNYKQERMKKTSKVCTFKTVLSSKRP